MLLRTFMFEIDVLVPLIGPLVQDKESAVLEKRNLCNPCPRGASCELGGSSVVPLPGYWTASEAVIRRTDLGLFNMLNDIQIYQCLPGTCHFEQSFPVLLTSDEGTSQ
jgi:hypothetical protein